MEIHWRNPNHLSDERRREVEERIERLAEGHRDLIDVWIDLEKSRHHRSGEDRATIRCMARDAEIVADSMGVDPDTALRESLEDFKREVHRHRDRLQRQRRQRRRSHPAWPTSAGPGGPPERRAEGSR